MAASLTAIDPGLAEAITQLIGVANDAGLQPRITSTLRTYWEQKRLYYRWRSGLSNLPAAVPGTSAHEFGWAVDLIVTPETYLADLGSVWTSWGGGWGGARDPVHFELKGAGAAARARGGGQYTAIGGIARTGIGVAVDYLIGLNPLIGGVEMAASLLSWGFPENQVLQFLSGPGSYLLAR